MIVRALRNHPYGGKIRAKGSEYDIKKASDIKLLIAIKSVEKVVEVDTNPLLNIQTNTSESNNQSGQEHCHKKRGRKRKERSTYGTKDLIATERD